MNNKGPSIRDVMTEAIRKGLNEADAIAHVRATIHVAKVSNKRLREYYALTVQTLDK